MYFGLNFKINDFYLNHSYTIKYMGRSSVNSEKHVAFDNNILRFNEQQLNEYFQTLKELKISK